MAVAVERPLERVGIVGSRHIRNADVVVQLHELAAEGIASSDVIGKVVPVGRAVDDEGCILGAHALGRPSHRHGVGRAARAGGATVAATASGSAVVVAVLPSRVVK